MCSKRKVANWLVVPFSRRAWPGAVCPGYLKVGLRRKGFVLLSFRLSGFRVWDSAGFWFEEDRRSQAAWVGMQSCGAEILA